MDVFIPEEYVIRRREEKKMNEQKQQQQLMDQSTMKKPETSTQLNSNAVWSLPLLPLSSPLNLPLISSVAFVHDNLKMI
ncbi:hypothetical protein QJS10_CPA08g00358 [Acorus calamus]|uniref:Uncharacterized protein n=1 Tax=Acorus calamus TaxID=4465 RepID=A0AAV9EA90_ACOCL|nr:hypothetical protein QJS10_CPA08g00358 [Acorus calamus]